MPHIVSLTHPELAQSVAKELGWNFLDLDVSQYLSGESRLKVVQSLSSSIVYVLQSTEKPVDRHMILYANLVDVLRHMGAERIVSFFSWLGYSLQDRRFTEQESDAFQTALRLLNAVSVSSTWALDVHSPNTLPKTWNMTSAWSLFADDMAEKRRLQNAIFISPDGGSRHRVEAFSSHLGKPSLCLQKERSSGSHVRISPLSPEDITFLKGKTAILLDDVINSGSTMIESARVLRDAGVQTIFVYATHGLFSGEAVKHLLTSEIDEIIVTDSIASAVTYQQKKIRILTISGLLMTHFLELEKKHTKNK